MRMILFTFLAACTQSVGDRTDLNAPNSPENPGSPAATAGKADDVLKSGSRLKMRVLKGEDGSQQFVSWFDSMHQVSCAFQRAEDDVQRCLPVVPANNVYIVSPFNGFRPYTDSSCTIPMAMVERNCNA